MKPFLSSVAALPGPTLHQQSRRTQLAAGAVVVMVLAAVLSQLGVLRELGQAALRPASAPETWSSLRHHTAQISLGLLRQLDSPNDETLAQIKADRELSEAMLKRLQAQYGHSSPLAFERLSAAQTSLEAALTGILTADQMGRDARKEFEKNKAAVIDAVETGLLGQVRANAWKGTDRLRPLLAAIAEARSFQPSLNARDPVPNAERFQKLLQQYARQAPPRQLETIRDTNRKLLACVAYARLAAEQKEKRQDAIARFAKARMDVEALGEELQAAGAQKEDRSVLPLLLRVGWGLGLFTGILILCGAAAVFVFGRRMEKHLVAPLQDMTACIEAAASGDLSRAPEHWSRDEVGRLSQAVSRLIAVMARSENLVYHLAALVEMSNDGIVSQSLDGTILSWNKGAQRIYGYSVDEIRGHSIGLLSPSDRGAEMQKVIESVKRGEKVPPFETLHQAKNGRLVHAFVKVGAIQDSTRRVIGLSFCVQELPGPALTAATPISTLHQTS